ncbi:hypothetical protein [Orenia marismortui]|uniref:Uncharacterized protein n=1 Tax=Orenia marismortui TaxID=46469 RepID=A0A4R8GXY9_9FIRM|nr:hypothetical protein [Orenia marismortui]TDX51146.1 hypothetical protein C7959_11522 [Orenia marismortui]
MNKKLKFYKNGFIVKRVDGSYGRKFGNYLGIEGDVWPLYKDIQLIEQSKLKYLCDFIDENVLKSYFDNSRVDVCSNIQFLNEYVSTCNKLDFNIEILLCETSRKKPYINIEEYVIDNQFEFLGYDYGYPGDNYYSCVYNDIGRVSEMDNIKLNKYGLFNSEEQVVNFYILRERLKQKNPQNFEFGEHDTDYTVYKISKYVGNLPILL